MARAVIVLAIAVVAAGSARADEPPASIDRGLADGRRLFDEQEYAAAIQVLSPIARDARATRSQRLAALERIALAHFIRRDLAAARATFERVLDIDPGYQLRDRSGAPAIRQFFDQLKRELIPGYDPEANADLEHAAPRGASAGGKLELDIRATRGGERVVDVMVRTRRRGELDYHDTQATPRGDARWRVRIPLAAAARPYVVEYYVEARGPVGEPVGRIASPDGPLEVPVGAGGSTGDPPWYRRWYVVAGAAVVITGIAGGAVFAATRGPDDGTLPPGTITVP